MAQVTTTYGISVHRVGTWWAIEVPELGIHTQARRLNQVEEMATDAIAATLDVPAQEVLLDVQIRLEGELDREWKAVQGNRNQAEDAQRRAARATGNFTHRLVEAGLSMREIAVILGVSHQRVSQLLGINKRKRESGEQNEVARQAQARGRVA